MPRAAWGPTVRRLVEVGLLEGRAVVDGRLSVEHVSRSNEVGIVCVDDRAVLIVKRDEVTVDGIHPFTAEVAAYQWLASHPDTAELAPRLVLAAGDHVVVLEAVADARTFHEALTTSADGPARALAELGRRLGTLHAARPNPQLLSARRPWVLGIPDQVVPGMLAGDPQIAALVAEVAADRAMRAVFDELRQAWRPATPIHGDVKFDNILVGVAGSTPERRLWLVDWELAGLGLPEWDLAGVVDGLLLPTLSSIDVEVVCETSMLASPAVEAHRSIVGPALAPGDRAIMVATVVRLVQSALQLQAMVHYRSESESAARLVLDAARTLAHHVVGPVETRICVA